MPEALVAALDELTVAWQDAMADPAFVAEFDTILREYGGLPSPLYHAERLSEKVGARILLKREDLNHTGAHKIRNVLGQALLTRRMGKTRVIAETGAGQHGVASATAAAYFGLDCTVYMGAVDTRRQALNVARMNLLGAKVVAGRVRQRDAEGRHQRGAARLGRERRPHGLPVRDRGRPAPVPEHGARLHPRHRRRGARPVPGAVRRAARRDRRVRRRRLERDRAVHRVPRRPRGRDLRLRGRRRGLRDRSARGHHPCRRRAACCTAPAPTCCRTRTARPSSPTRSRPAWTTPASDPSTPTSPRPAGRRTSRSPTPRRMEAMALLAAHRGDHPGDRVRARGRRRAGRPRLAEEQVPRQTILVNLSGRGDKDMGTAIEYFGLRRR